MRLWMMGLLASSLGAPSFAPEGGPSRDSGAGTLYFFFSPTSTGSLEGAKRAVAFIKGQKGQIKLRLVLLLDDFSVIRKVEESSLLAKTLRELQTQGALDIPLYDEEGLLLAQRWELKSVPAFVLVARGQAHRAVGPVVKLEELLECRS